MTDTTAKPERAAPIGPLEPHPLADRFPLIEGEEFDHLVDDIRTHGQREPIVLHEGKILDGRNRYRACLEAGKQPKVRQFDPRTEGSPEAFVISVNLKRRHLTSKQKREFILELLKANPSASDRAIARDVGVDGKTVAAVREEMIKGLQKFKDKWQSLGPAQQKEFVAEFRADLSKLLP
jgi:ParB-like nuclease domain